MLSKTKYAPLSTAATSATNTSVSHRRRNVLLCVGSFVVATLGALLGSAYGSGYLPGSSSSSARAFPDDATVQSSFVASFAAPITNLSNVESLLKTDIAYSISSDAGLSTALVMSQLQVSINGHPTASRLLQAMNYPVVVTISPLPLNTYNGFVTLVVSVLSREVLHSILNSHSSGAYIFPQSVTTVIVSSSSSSSGSLSLGSSSSSPLSSIAGSASSSTSSSSSFSSSSAASPVQQTTKVFLLAGQSNMVGYDNSINDNITAYTSPQLTAVQFGSNKIIPAIDPLFGNGNGIGPGMSFGYNIVQQYGWNVTLIACAASGTAFQACAGYAGYYAWNPESLSLALNCVTQTRAVLASDPGRYEVAGVLWLQGEYNSCHSASGPFYNIVNVTACPANNTLPPDPCSDQNNYTAAIQGLASYFRASFNVSNLPFVLHTMYAAYNGGPVQTAIMNMSNNLPYSSVAMSIRPDSSLMSKGIHFPSYDQRTIGFDFTQAFRASSHNFFGSLTPGIIVQLWPTSVNSTAFTLVWVADPIAKTYDIMMNSTIYTSVAFSPSTRLGLISSIGCQFFVSGMIPNTSYSVSVRGVGPTGVAGEWSLPKQVGIISQPPWSLGHLAAPYSWYSASTIVGSSTWGLCDWGRFVGNLSAENSIIPTALTINGLPTFTASRNNALVGNNVWPPGSWTAVFVGSSFGVGTQAGSTSSTVQNRIFYNEPPQAFRVYAVDNLNYGPPSIKFNNSAVYNRWVATYNASTADVTYFVNGQAAGTGSHPGGPTAHLTESTLAIGRGWTQDGNPSNWAELMVFDYVQDASMVQLYDAAIVAHYGSP